jgi:hypothetical protein
LQFPSVSFCGIILLTSFGEGKMLQFPSVSFCGIIVSKNAVEPQGFDGIFVLKKQFDSKDCSSLSLHFLQNAQLLHGDGFFVPCFRAD